MTAIQKNTLINSIDIWSNKKRYKVNDVVSYLDVVYQNVTGFNSSPTNLIDWKATVKDDIKQDKLDSYVIVGSDLDKLPEPIGGVINLASNTAYLFTSNIDLLGNRLVCGVNTVIMGSSSENVKVISSTLSSSIALITSNYSLPIRNITFSHPIVFDLQGDGVTTAIDWVAVNIQDSESIGYISDYSNIIVKDSAFVNSGDLIFDGTIGTIGFDGCLFTSNINSNAIIVIPSTATITRRFRIIYSAVVADLGTSGVAFAVNSSANIPIEGYILDTVNFSGIGPYLVGINNISNKALFVNNKGISNTRVISNYTMNGNATVTPITTVSTPVKILGTTINNSITGKFDNSVSNRSTYTGAFSRVLKVVAILSLTSNNNNVIGCYIVKNGTIINDSRVYGTTSGSGRSENIVCQTLIELNQDDYIEIFIENNTGTNNITVSDLNVIID